MDKVGELNMEGYDVMADYLDGMWNYYIINGEQAEDRKPYDAVCSCLNVLGTIWDRNSKGEHSLEVEEPTKKEIPIQHLINSLTDAQNHGAKNVILQGKAIIKTDKYNAVHMNTADR